LYTNSTTAPEYSTLSLHDALPISEISQRVDYEAELAAVIGKKCSNISPEEAEGYIFGYTAMNDVTARDIQKSDGQWTRGKSFDRSEEHTSELQSRENLVCRLLLEK